ncbi:MAG: hypothetical protein EOP38_05420 [Rubrivivax sp.]|nr:MAG: hypothetical protein EOP38_05420 [Rubrivivax sp.]
MAILNEAITSQPPRWPVLLMHGPGGVGKTTLLERMRQMAAQAGLDSLRLDGRDVDPSPAGLLHALGLGLGLAAAAIDRDTVLAGLEARPRRLLIIDTFEQLQPLETWLRTDLLPAMPDATVVVLAGRVAPQQAWRTDPLWQGLARVLPLRNLAAEDCEAYLRKQHIADEWHPRLTASSHGHPLALSLMAEVVRTTGELPEHLRADLIRDLADRFLALAPSPLHRSALEVCAHVRRTTEALLADVVDVPRAPELFQWLTSLNFIERGSDGLFPHDLMREAIEEEFASRDPERARGMRLAVRRHLMRLVEGATPFSVWPKVCDLAFQIRHSPMRHYTDYRAMGSAWFRPATPSDHGAVTALIRAELPPAEVACALAWARHPASIIWVAGLSPGEITGMTLALDMNLVNAADTSSDPLMTKVTGMLERRGPLHPGCRHVVNRYNLGHGGQRRIEGGVGNAIQMAQYYQWISMPDIHHWVVCVEEPNFWFAMMDYLGFQHQPDCDTRMSGVLVGCFVHDWRAQPAAEWALNLVMQRTFPESGQGTSSHLEPPTVADTSPSQALSRSSFEQAVKLALRQLGDPLALASNPLATSDIVAKARRASEKPAATLQRVLFEAAESLAERPRDTKFWRALELTYFRPAGSQELAAERLGLPFGTYRYQLMTGIERLVDVLWRRETEADN